MNSRVLFISLYRISSLWKVVLILMTSKNKRLSYLRDLILGVWKKNLFFFLKKRGGSLFCSYSELSAVTSVGPSGMEVTQ